MAASIRQSWTRPAARPLYTPEQRVKRDATVWTKVQGVLAIAQFAVFLISLALVLRWALTGDGYAAATISIVVKTFTLAAIMVTGSIWEKVVFGQWLLAPAFFWEDMVSFVVIALHATYVAALFGGWLTPHQLISLALVAYASYAINAAQFILKLRAARLQSERGALVGGATA